MEGSEESRFTEAERKAARVLCFLLCFAFFRGWPLPLWLSHTPRTPPFSLPFAFYGSPLTPIPQPPTPTPEPQSPPAPPLLLALPGLLGLLLRPLLLLCACVPFNVVVLSKSSKGEGPWCVRRTTAQAFIQVHNPTNQSPRPCPCLLQPLLLPLLILLAPLPRPLAVVRARRGRGGGGGAAAAAARVAVAVVAPPLCACCFFHIRAWVS